ncbi:MAG: rhodanese-like domain-containing protein [Thermoleophilia bacterium]|jgi:rhodanese-related sulfurtransferase|nr:rhodanese-like domain-containing protein [Thermoleophilia bacterium]
MSEREFTPREAYEAWQRGEVAIIDVREESEHLATHVPGMPLVPMSEILDRLDDIPRGRPLVVMCRSGQRSATVADYLNAQGEFDPAHNLSGGILAWAAGGLPYEGIPPH